MVEYKHREIESATFLGERIDFVAANERVKERVQSLSHEKTVLKEMVNKSNPDDVVWDVGACLGIHSFATAKHLPDGMVYSFEPMHSNRAVCVDNKAVNEIENVHVSKFALSNTNGEQTFEIREGIEPGYGRHGLKADQSEYESVREIQVPTSQGDNVDLEQPNIVKIDVEGASPLVIKGMEETLSDPACRVVILETHEPNPVQPSHEDFGMTRNELIEKLETLGFNVETLNKDYHIIGTKTNEKSTLLENTECEVTLTQGDIANQQCDAIINSAGTSLRMGTGVAGSLREKGGNKLYYEALEKGPINIGEAETTDAHELDANHVIHAASMPHYGDGKSTQNTIRKSVINALETAENLNCTEIAIPAIGCGLGGVSITTGATTILKTINRFNFNTIEKINFVLYSEDEYETVKNYT
jgi:FkbM family methyltransferase